MQGLSREEEVIYRQVQRGAAEESVRAANAALRDRYAPHQVAVGGPWMTVNEARRLEGMQPVEGGSRFLGVAGLDEPFRLGPGDVSNVPGPNGHEAGRKPAPPKAW